MGKKRKTRPQGSIRLREGGYEVRLPYSIDKKRSVLAGRFTSFEDAEEALKEAIAKTRHQQTVDTVRSRRGVSVAELCHQYVDARAKDPDGPLATNTIVGYRSVIDLHIAPTAFGKKSINMVDETDVNKWYQTIASTGTSKSRREYARRVISASFTWAAGLGMMPPLQLSTVRKRSTKLSKQTTSTSVVLPTWKQFAEIVEQPTRWEDRLLLALLGWCGLRFGEARSLNATDLNVDEETIRVERVWVRRPATLTGTGKAEWVVEPVKAGNPADVPVPSPLFVELLQLARKRNFDGLLFRADQHDRGGLGILSSSNFNSRVFYPARTYANAPDVKVKDLRAFAGSTLVDAGATIVEVAGMLRHDVRTSERYYLRPSPSDPDRYTLRQHATGATLTARIGSLYGVWANRFPNTAQALKNPIGDAK